MLTNYKQVDLTGQRFGRLTVIKSLGRQKRGVNTKEIWLCQCDCGNQKDVADSELLHGHTRSCGCLHKEMVGSINKTHGLSQGNPRLYKIWKEMRYRCSNPGNKSYPRYGGRGISVCDEWQDFQNFYDWSIANGYKEDIAPGGRNRISIDRIDNDGNYEPSNCRWTTDYVQSRNKRNSLAVTEKYVTCPVCGKTFIRTQRSGAKTCSVKCGRKYHSIRPHLT